MRDHDCFSSDIEPLQERGAYTTAVVATSLDSKQANFSPPDARSQYGMTAIKAVQMRGLRESEDVLCEAIARFAKKKNGEKIEEVLEYRPGPLHSSERFRQFLWTAKG